jgi:hypothetical protein
VGASPVLKAEQEPNDAPANAMLLTLADTISGAIGSEGDIDYFAIDLTAGTQLDFSLDIAGSALYNPTLALIDRDGVTMLSEQNWESREYRIRYTIPTAGRYFVRVGNYRPGIGAYVLRLGRYVAPASGPADPVTTVWSTASLDVSGIAVNVSGDIFVAAPAGVYRVGSTGDSVLFAPGIDASRGIAVDRRGNVFTLGCEYPNGVVWRISPTGVRSRFFLGKSTPDAITVGPDGDLWIYDFDSSSLWRFDPDGHRKATTLRQDGYLSHLAFSPTGQLHYTGSGGLYRVVNDAPELVIPAHGQEWFSALAFDRDGYIYVAVVTPKEGGSEDRLLLFDPEYRLATDPLAQVGDHFAPSRITALAFACDRDGRMATRLLVGQTRTATTQPLVTTSAIVELNRVGIRAPGWPIGGPVIVLDDVVSAALGVQGILSPEQEQLLDTQGNHNGVLDIGDLRAYLRSHQP